MKGLATILTMAGILFSCHCFSQNLVPNGSFEVFNNCPYWGNEIYYAVPWFQPDTCKGNIINSSSSDYFNVCSVSLSVPLNGGGYQNAKTGNAYAGIILFHQPPTEYREYIEVKIDSPLISGLEYCVDFFISLSNTSMYGIDAIHALMSSDSILGSLDPSCGNGYLDFVPQIKNNNGIITDTLNWTSISGKFIAAGGEQYLTIGNFNSNDSTNWILLSNNSQISYYYIDDVSVTFAMIR